MPHKPYSGVQISVWQSSDSKCSHWLYCTLALPSLRGRGGIGAGNFHALAIVGVTPWQRLLGRQGRAARGTSVSRHPDPLLAQIVDQQIFPQSLRGDVEGPATVDAGHLIDERDQGRVVIQHEHTELDAGLGETFHLL